MDEYLDGQYGKITTVLSQRDNISEAVCSLEPYAGFE
jgi:hypothetical protein